MVRRRARLFFRSAAFTVRRPPYYQAPGGFGTRSDAGCAARALDGDVGEDGNDAGRELVVYHMSAMGGFPVS
jgi:hypothetical protein